MFLERGSGMERGRQTWICCPNMPPAGDLSHSQMCPDRNQTSNIFLNIFPINTFFFCTIFKKDFVHLFFKRGEGREKERERNINVCLPLTWLPLGTWPTIQACALTGNEPETLWFTGCTQSTEPHQPGPVFFFFKIIYLFTYLPLERGKGGRQRRRETSICACLSHAPNWGPSLKPRHVP